MALEPLRIVPTSRLCNILVDVGTEYAHSEQTKGDCANAVKAFRQIAEANRDIKYVAMCTAPMLQAYKTLPDLAGVPTLNYVVSIFDFTKLNTAKAHSLQKWDHTKVAEALISYATFLNSVPTTDSPSVLCVTSTLYNMSNSRNAGKVMREKIIQNLLSSLSATSNPDYQVYFDWLREYGEDI